MMELESIRTNLFASEDEKNNESKVIFLVERVGQVQN
jgi:hypothetical protein